ncbi:MAG TPA: hypothetical protein ENK19_04125 [Acidobacteria bacterium]|nr:hypothetical protein [Acidobacteriota bacterium]
MRQRLTLVVTIVFTIVLGAGVIHGQELVFNGSFGTDLRGWTMSDTPVAWSPRDAGGLADSGSVLIVNLGSRNNARGIRTCLDDVTFLEGEKYRIAAQVHMPENQTNTGFVGLGLNWYTEADCGGGSIGNHPRARFDEPNGGFEEVATELTVPEGAKSARLVVYVTKREDEGALLAYVDDISLVPVGSSPSATPIYVPGAAHVNGYGGAVWRTDLEVGNPTTAQSSFTVELLKEDQANTHSQSATYTLGPGKNLRMEDVVETVFGYDGAASLRIVPAEPTLVVTSRTFNQSASGTYGQFLPGIPRDRAIVHGRQARLIGLTHNRAGGAGYRTNIGLVNVMNMEITVDVRLFAASGVELGTVTADLPAAGFIQLDKVFEQVSATDVADGYALLTTPTPGGAFLTYASVIDNVTGDAVCVQPADL